MPLRVVFLGTPAFSVPCLQALLAAEDVQLLGVVTQPDKPAGRGQQLTPPPIKLLAEEAGLPVHQPKSIRKDAELIGWLKAQQPDFFVTIAFGQILSQEVLDIPKFGTVNVHASLLPQYRGANPIQWAVIDGQPETGLTTMLTDIGVDTGAMLLKATTPIDENETAGQLFERLSAMGGDLLLKTLRGVADGSVTPTPQDGSVATHARKMTKEDAWLDWTVPAQTLHNKIRGQQPWPGAQSLFNGEMVKIIESRLPKSGLSVEGAPGTVGKPSAEGLPVATGEGTILITQLQPAGKKPMAARDWANGALARAEASPRFASAPVEVSAP